MGCEEARLLLDAYVDGELSAQQEADLLAHVHACEACKGEFEAAMLLKDCLKDMDEEVAVPLEAQAAWRRAVHAEAKRKFTRKWTRVVSAAAAALVLVLGVGFLADREAPVAGQPVPEAAALSIRSTELIAADGEQQNAVAVAAAGSEEYTARKKFAAADVQAAGKTIEMLTAEYSGSFSLEGEGDSVRYRVELPADYMADFLSAASRIGTELDSEAVEAAGETVVILIQLEAA